MQKTLVVLTICLMMTLGLVLGWSVAPAVAIDTYVSRYLQAREPVKIEIDNQGTLQEFTLDSLSAGKKLFELHCLNCHVGGATLPDPTISLSLRDLHGATPPRDNVGSLVAFLREPMTYDGTDVTYWCRQVPETWMCERLPTLIARNTERASRFVRELLQEPSARRHGRTHRVVSKRADEAVFLTLLIIV